MPAYEIRPASRRIRIPCLQGDAAAPNNPMPYSHLSGALPGTHHTLGRRIRLLRTHQQAELVLTRIARDRAFVLKWQFNGRGIGQGTPIIVPKAVLGIHQDPKRRRCNGLCLGHPALKRQEGRATHCRP